VAQTFVCEGGHRVVKGEALEQHVLVQRTQVHRRRCRGQRIGHAPDFLALAVVFGAVGKRGLQGYGENGFLVLGLHVVSLCGDRWSVAQIPHARVKMPLKK
jgi:hypothetical protein